MLPIGCLGKAVIGVDKIAGGMCGLPGTLNKVVAPTPPSGSTHPVNPQTRST